ncbi:MAG: hypothetical protein ACXABY_20285 [Candidatus Thorarchaeota archaeon]|jgi:hypothetical protein
MADLPVPRQRNDLSKPPIKVHKLWLEQQIAEKKARVSRLKAAGEEILNGRLKSIEADIIMAERDVMALTQKLDELERRDDTEVIDINKEG